MTEKKRTAARRRTLAAAESLAHLAAPVAEGAIFPFDAAKSNITNGGNTNGDCNRRV